MLSHEEADEIRRLYAEGAKPNAIAKAFNVSDRYIHMLVAVEGASEEEVERIVAEMNRESDRYIAALFTVTPEEVTEARLSDDDDVWWGMALRGMESHEA